MDISADGYIRRSIWQSNAELTGNNQNRYSYDLGHPGTQLHILIANPSRDIRPAAKHLSNNGQGYAICTASPTLEIAIHSASVHLQTCTAPGHNSYFEGNRLRGTTATREMPPRYSQSAVVIERHIPTFFIGAGDYVHTLRT